MYRILLYDVIPDDFKPAGAFGDCFKYYPHFAGDFELLVKEGYVKITSPKTYMYKNTKQMNSI